MYKETAFRLWGQGAFYPENNYRIWSLESCFFFGHLKKIDDDGKEKER